MAAPEPAAKEPESGPPRTTSAEKRRKSVLHLSEAEIAEKERERQEAVRPGRLQFGDDDDDEGATTAEPHREAYVAKGRPLWPLGLLLAAAVIGVSMVPAVRIRVMAILQSPCEEPGPVDTTALFLDVVDSASHHVPVEVWLGKKALGTTPLENAMVPEGELTLRLSNLALGIDRELVLHAKGSTLRPPKVTIALGRVSFHADKDCNVFMLGNQVARANGPPLDFLEGTYEAECRNEALALIGKARVVIPKDRSRIIDIPFKLVPMTDQKP